MNPILPKHYYIPDVEARTWSDGRIYLYGSWDVEDNTNYCSKIYHVFSSDDFVNWTDHGQSFDISRAHSRDGQWLYAPDCICKDGTYYLLYCANDGSEGIAESATPAGPFGQGAPIEGADRDGIDPAALVDDDGSVYYFWGQFQLRGARLTSDLRSIDTSTLTTNILTEKEHGFHEGACIRKRNGVYYLVYTDISRGKATSMAYATSDAPLGPYTKGGIIVDNIGCDPETWNDHGSIAEFNGRWYVFYHRSSHGSKFSRRVCVEPITFNDDGGIDEVEMTTQGAWGPLPATRKIDAYRACLLSGTVRSASIPRQREGDDYVERLTSIHNGDWAAYKYLDFGEGVQGFAATLGSLAVGSQIEVRVDSQDGPLVCTCDVPITGGWNVWERATASLETSVTGVHAVYLVFQGGGGRLMDLLDFSFES